MRRSLKRVAMSVVVGLGLVGCGSPGAAGAAERAGSSGVQFPLTFENCGQEIVLDHRPERVVTIGTPAVDALYAAGASDLVVARAGEYEVPATGPAGAAVEGKPIIDPEQPSLEKIIGSGADMVVGYGLGLTTAEDLASAGISHYVLTSYCGPHGGGTGDGGQIADIYADLEFLGQVFGTEDAAARSVRDLRERVAAIEAGPPAGDRTSAAAIYFLGDAIYTYGNEAIASDQMRILGLVNALGSVDQTTELNIEELIAANPDVVILIYGYQAGDTFEGQKQKFLAVPGVGDITAVVTDDIVGVTGPEVEGSPIAVDGLDRMADSLRALGAKAAPEAPAPEPGGCDYSPCLPASPDLDCSDLDGPVQVIGSDPHGLDLDGDGVGCEPS